MLSLDIHKQLGGFALDLELDAPAQSLIVLFGPSGAGKSLTLAAIAGLLMPDSGRIAVGHQVLFDSARRINLPPQARHLGLVRQDLALFPHLSVRDNITYGLARPNGTGARARADELLRLMNLQGLAAHRPSELSGGQQQRVALARSLAIRPSVLLLDEPFSALDRPTRVQLRSELQALQKHFETSVLFVTHDLGEAFLLADVLAVMDNGRLLQIDVPERILNQPRTLRVAQVVGIANILPAVVLDASHVRIGERELEADAAALAAGQQAHVTIRPERITLVRKERPVDGLPNTVAGDLVSEVSDGSNVMLRFRAEGPRLRPEEAFDLQIDTPVYVYERLALAAERHWSISIKPAVMHVIAP